MLLHASEDWRFFYIGSRQWRECPRLFGPLWYLAGFVRAALDILDLNDGIQYFLRSKLHLKLFGLYVHFFRIQMHEFWIGFTDSRTKQLLQTRFNNMGPGLKGLNRTQKYWAFRVRSNLHEKDYPFRVCCWTVNCERLAREDHEAHEERAFGTGCLHIWYWSRSGLYLYTARCGARTNTSPIAVRNLSQNAAFSISTRDNIDILAIASCLIKGWMCPGKMCHSCLVQRPTVTQQIACQFSPFEQNMVSWVPGPQNHQDFKLVDIGSTQYI